MDQEVQSQVKDKMMKAIGVLKDDLATIRTGRASPALVENVVISAYENTQHLRVKEMATITTDGPRMIIISPFDLSIIKDIERSINAANLGINAYIDGPVVRINIPTLTAERREEYIKLAHTKLEGGRVMIRQVRHEAMGDVKKRFENKEISEDDKKRLEKEIQILTDELIAEVDVLRERKEAELREI
ncbi:ribosome recycling factor [Candidatus Gottesmanbacteria bacterium]|nr:ribosome recycling factor [Candidatus Gottesmanbacteria bacterium]